jgi:hypothetical protein
MQFRSASDFEMPVMMMSTSLASMTVATPTVRAFVGTLERSLSKKREFATIVSYAWRRASREEREKTKRRRTREPDDARSRVEAASRLVEGLRGRAGHGSAGSGQESGGRPRLEPRPRRLSMEARSSVPT